MGNKGRPRSEKTERAILSATYTLLLESGFHAVTVEGIAKQAGVSKATIYKWWPNKAAVAADSFFAAAAEQLTEPDTGSAEEDLLIQLQKLGDFFATDKGRIITELIAEGQFDPEVARAYRTRYFYPRRLVSKAILERGVARGELKADLDLELSVDLVFAPLFYRLLITGAEIGPDTLRKMVAYALDGIRKR